MSTTLWAVSLAAVLELTVAQQYCAAGSATWASNPVNSDWNTSQNWAPQTIPNASADTATFGASTITDVGISALTEISGLSFDMGASSYTIAPEPGIPVTVSGVGINNASGNVQTFAAQHEDGFAGAFFFRNSATAGRGTVFPILGTLVSFNDSSTADHAMFTVMVGDGFSPGSLDFRDAASAGNATINTESGGSTDFDEGATAANAIFTATGGTSGPGYVSFGASSTAGGADVTCSAGGGSDFSQFATADHARFTLAGAVSKTEEPSFINFSDNSTAAEGRFLIGGGSAAGAPGAVITFYESSTAENATLRVGGGLAGGAGGTLVLRDKSSGGTARVALSGNGSLDLSLHKPGSVTIGSLEGDGLVFLGAGALAVGSNNHSTGFSGTIADGGSGGGAGGRLTKVGTGILKLSGASSYTGGTTVSAGALAVWNQAGSSTGTGRVQVNGGTLAGPGLIAGAVTIGSGSGTGAILAPGRGAVPATTLSIASTLTLKADATYDERLGLRKGQSDLVIAHGVTIESGAQFALQAIGRGQLPAGGVVTVISNTSADPIAGTFANLADGSILSSGANQLQASYHGGDGNDLTLTVLP